MLQYISHLFDSSEFSTRWQSGGWTEEHAWLYILSDLSIWCAYVTIPIVIGYCVYRRKDVPFRIGFLLFGAFVLASGTTHLLDALMFWWRAYRLAAFLKFLTALVSWCVVFTLVRITPRVLTLRNPADLENEIAERKRAEAALRASEERYRQLFEANPHAMWVYDAESFRFLAVNDVAVWQYGYTREEFLGMTVKDLVAPEENRPWRSVLGESDRLYRYRLASGEIRQVEVAAHPIEFGGRAAWLVLALDVTEQKLLEEQLKQAQKLESIGQLAAGIAHEINTPIQYIGDNTNFLSAAFQDMSRILPLYQAAAKDPVKLAEADKAAEQSDLAYLVGEVPRAIEQTLDGVGHVARIVKAMKEFAHPGSDDKTAVDLNRAIQNVVTVTRNEWKYLAEVSTDLDPDLPTVLGLPGELNQVFLNLIMNAVHAIQAAGSAHDNKGSIKIATRRLGNVVEVRIADTGSGIPEAIRRRIFDPFFTTKPVGQGTGQGLAIAHAVVVTRHNGAITFESKVGYGTTFIVRLPINGIRLSHSECLMAGATQRIAPAPISRAIDSGGTGMKRRVIFVDDEPNILEALQRMLRPLRNEWDMQFARGGVEALALMAENPADVIVTDMRMPGMDGDELLTSVRQTHPQTVRIVLTGQCARGAVLRLIPLAHRILSKPFDADGLRNVLRRTYCLRDLLTSPTLLAVVGHLGGLPALPDLYVRVLSELDNPDVSLPKVAALVSEDVGLVTKLMQMSNSALFGLRQPVSSPLKAIQVLGIEMTRATLMAANVFNRYDPAGLKPFSIDSLWNHSRKVGEIAAEIVKLEGVGDRVTDAALAGLLHDVGRLTLATQQIDLYRQVLKLVRDEGLALIDAEMRVFGTTHAEVGAYLLGLWGLADPIVEAVAFHHTPSRCPGERFNTLTAVHAAEAILGTEEGTRLDTDYLDSLKLGHRVAAWMELATK